MSATRSQDATSQDAPVAPITAGAAISVHARMQRLVLRRGRLPLVLLAIALLPAVLSALLLAWSKGPELFDSVLDLELRALVPLAAALAMAGLLGEELDRQTATFSFARPAPRWTLLAGRFVAVVPPLAVVLVVAVLAQYVIAMTRADLSDATEGLGHLARAMVAAVLVLSACAAAAAALGSIFHRHPMLATGAWILLDYTTGGLDGTARWLSVGGHARALAGLGTGSEAPPAALAAIALVVFTVVWGVAAAWAIERVEPRPPRE